MASFDQKAFQRGRLDRIDKLENGDPDVGKAIATYSEAMVSDRQGNLWLRTVNWVENLLFGLGHHYTRDMISSRITRDSQGNYSEAARSALNKVPQPTNDLLGRYVETNIALLTENRPEPRVTAKGDDRLDKQAAEYSQLVIQYLWEKLNIPEKLREIARLVLYTGTAWLELCYDDTQVRHMTVPQTESQPAVVPGTDGLIQLPVDREVPVMDKRGRPVMGSALQYGDITSTVVSGFEMYFPSTTQGWNSEQMGWVMREFFAPIDAIKDKYTDNRVKGVMTKANGWYPEALNNVKGTNIYNLPIWWWERLCDAVEGPGPSLFVSSKDTWDDHVIVRVFDRRPNPNWPKGRTIVTVNDKVLYDSPKKIGARAFNPRFPDRWHPYVRFRWEAIAGSTYGRSLVSKLLPKLKRVNAIDTTLIMWRRTVPIACWIMPKGCALPGSKCVNSNGKVEVIEGFKKGALVQSYDAVRSVKALMTYQNDEKIVKLTGKGVLPIKFTYGHHTPVLRKEDVNKAKRELTDISKVQDVHIGTIKPGDYVLSSFKRDKVVETLRVDDYLYEQRSRVGIPNFIPIDQNFKRLAGLYLAEGNVMKGHGYYKGIRFTIGAHEKDTLGAEIADLIYKVFSVSSKTKVETNKNEHTRCVIEACNVDLAKLFSVLFGEGAKNKFIHDDIFFATDSLLPLVGGFFDGDGCYHKAQKGKTFRIFDASTISENLAYQLRSILLDEKIWVNFSANGKDRNNTKYVLRLSSHYLEKVQPYCNKIDKIEYKKVCDQGFWVGNVYFTKVKKVEFEDYVGPVYDLSIADKHYYQVNGVIVHNTNPVEGQVLGRPGNHIVYDARMSGGNEPKPVYPPEYPRTAIEERSTQISEMEAISGTEEVLRGERPQGVNSASMLSVLRKQALASRSAILQTWDESIQTLGSAILQEVAEHIKDDPQYAARLKILAREKGSSFAIERFSGADISDNVIVRVDTASMAMVSREARQQRAIEVLQYAQGLVALPPTLQAKIIDDLGWPDGMAVKSADITRAQTLISFMKSNKFEYCVPFPEDDAYVIHEFLVDQLKAENTLDWSKEQFTKLIELINYYQAEIVRIEQSRIAMQQQLQTQAAMANAAPDMINGQ